MTIKHLTDKNFTNEVENFKTVLVDFWAPWCSPCKMISPILEEIDKDFQGILKIYKLDVDDNPVSSSKYGIMGIPALILFKNGKPIERIIGFHCKDNLINIINNHIN